MSEMEAVQPAQELPTEPAQPVQDQAQADVAEQGADDSTEQEREPPKPRGVQKRIDELTGNWREAQRERDYWRQVAMTQMQGQGGYEQQIDYAAADVAAGPSVSDMVAYEFQRRDTQARAQAFIGSVGDRDVQDFLMSEHSPLPASVWDVMMSVQPEQGRDIATWLATNPDRAAQISRLPTHLQAVEIFRSAGLGAKSAPAPAPKRTSSAPAPAPTVKAAAAVDPDPVAMTTDQWMKWRNAQSRGR